MDLKSPRFKQIASTGILLLAAIIWGMCFVAQRSGMEHIGPFLFNGLREVLGSITLLAVLLVIRIFTHRKHSKRSQEEPSSVTLRYLLIAGLICGVALYFASNLQQVGIVYVTASKAAFITTLYIVLVPIIGLFIRQKTRWNTWVSVAIAVVGLYLLCVGESFSLEPGDAILLVSAFFWAIHILAVGHFAPQLTLIQLFGMCALQFAVTGVLSLGTAPFVDHFFVGAPVSLEAISFVIPELLYAGILSTAVAFTLMAVGQKYAKPTPAAIIMSTESVFGLLGGVLLLGEVLSLPEGIGCLLMLAAVILTQLDFNNRERKAPSASLPDT